MSYVRAVGNCSTEALITLVAMAFSKNYNRILWMNVTTVAKLNKSNKDIIGQSLGRKRPDKRQIRNLPVLVETADHSVDAALFRKALIAWGRKNFRPFIWRMTSDPYHLLMAEVMLHRTQAQQVEPVYIKFIKLYPTLDVLSRASNEELHRVLFSLGLRHRIDYIHQMITQLMVRFGGQIPKDKAALLSLPGVSDYIASAVRCFAWNIPEPLIDTNTVRVIGRVFGLEIKDSSRRNPVFRKLITALVDPKEPIAYNYALLDLADRVCTKKKPPDVKNCPLLSYCNHGNAILLEGSNL